MNADNYQPLRGLRVAPRGTGAQVCVCPWCGELFRRDGRKSAKIVASVCAPCSEAFAMELAPLERPLPEDPDIQTLAA